MMDEKPENKVSEMDNTELIESYNYYMYNCILFFFMELNCEKL